MSTTEPYILEILTPKTNCNSTRQSCQKNKRSNSIYMALNMTFTLAMEKPEQRNILNAAAQELHIKQHLSTEKKNYFMLVSHAVSFPEGEPACSSSSAPHNFKSYGLSWSPCRRNLLENLTFN